jgi:hypothetical protein
MPQKFKILSDEFEFIGEGGVDQRNRLSLSKALSTLKERLGELGDSLDALYFRVYINRAGQILLDPAVTIPVREMWLYRDPVALAKVREGLSEAAKGELHDLGSWTRIANAGKPLTASRPRSDAKGV